MEFLTGAILSLLVLCYCFFCGFESLGYAQERVIKEKKYSDYSVTLDSGYTTLFYYDFGPNILYFKDNSKKIILSYYRERGLSTKFILINKFNIQIINSDLSIYKENIRGYISPDYLIVKNNKIEHFNNFKTSMSFMGFDYETGLKTLLYQKEDQRVSLDTILDFSTILSTKNANNSYNPGLKIGVSYANNFDLYNLKDNFTEMTLLTKLNPKVKNRELFLTAILVFKFSYNVSFVFGFENNNLYGNSFERYVFTNVYKKTVTKNINTEAEKLEYFIENHSLPCNKKVERKIQAKIGYKINANNELYFDYFYRFSKNINPHMIKFSFITYL